jgi:hypothetical protein
MTKISANNRNGASYEIDETGNMEPLLRRDPKASVVEVMIRHGKDGTHFTK